MGKYTQRQKLLAAIWRKPPHTRTKEDWAAIEREMQINLAELCHVFRKKPLEAR